MNTNPARPTTAYYFQAITSFSVALAVLTVGEICLPLPPWTRAFLALGTLFLVSSCFTLAKCVRDQQDTESVVSRLDQARIERLLSEFDPYRTPNITDQPPANSSGMATGPLSAAPYVPNN
ncbi:MAG TPA: YiaA/YiaB family inner membrane protein [Jatrophihabitans sp.]|jgi:hypothetical protein|nr:YiaA/YiaB family inner membrane protein [Jatrophihabitans sp.]